MANSKSNSIIQIGVVVAIIVLINVLAVDYFARLDLTDDNRYTLSNATIDILENLDEPVTITAYFTEDLPPRLIQERKNFKDLLIEYSSYSDGMVNYEFVNPNEEDKTAREAMQAGVQPVIINVREKDQVKQQRAYMGAVIRKGDEKEVLPVITQESSLEYSLSSNIKKLSATHKPKVGFVTGHGEPSLQELAQVVKSLSVLYTVEEVNISETDSLSKYKTLVIVAPSDSIPSDELDALNQYLAGGGNIYAALNRVKGDFSQARGMPLTTGLEGWLAEKGLKIGNNFVVDNRSGTVGVTQNRGGFRMTTQVKFPYLPLITNFSDHPITKGLEQVIFQFASSIEYTGDTTLNFVPLARSSENSGKKVAPLMFQVQKEWTREDFNSPEIPVAAALTGPIVGAHESKLVVISDGDFAVGGKGRNQRRQSEDNISLMVNGVDWLSDDTGLIDLRTKGISSRPIDELEEGTKTLLRYGNFFLPILLIVVYGIIRKQRQRALRVKRMEEGYV